MCKLLRAIGPLSPGVASKVLLALKQHHFHLAPELHNGKAHPIVVCSIVPHMELLPLQVLPSLSAPYSSVLKKACLCLTHRYILRTNSDIQHISANQLKTGTAVLLLCYLEPRPRIIIGWCGRRKGKKRTIVGKGTRGKAELCGRP